MKRTGLPQMPGITVGGCLVEGLPVTQGNHRVSPRGHIYEQNSAELHAWRSRVAWSVRLARMPHYDEPVAVTLEFRLPRPKRPRFSSRPATRPDIDKLTRPILDALTAAQILTDDALVVTVIASKHYSDAQHPVGVVIGVVPIGDAA